ncbi:hypothetical protein [Paraburkholderia azotifigens]|uniref:hypothetical protein n=1 Tax=Paraburkholderia azotifigens TaxID=2057004 RepID=UPI003B8A68B6
MKVAMPQHRPPTETPPSRTAPGEFNPKPRLSPPRSTSRLVVRERLLNQLLEARRKRCIVVQGPAGCGKTTTLTIWREELLLLGFDVPWLTLTAEDNDMSACLGYLVASLTQVDPALTCEAALLGGRGSDAEAVERTLIALVSAIASYPNDLMLILDDFHLVADNRVHEAFQWLLDYAPPNLHLALATRTTPSLSLGRLRDQGLLLELDMRDLRFTLAESEAFLKTQIANVGQREARRLHELTDGWIAGLQLLAIGLKKNKQVISELAAEDEFLHPALRDAPAFADYFQRQILSRLLPLEVELLVRMSACTRMCPSLCEALIADAQHATGIVPLLSKLAADNFFIAPLEQPAGVVWYRLNPLFRETLLARLRSRSEAQQRDIHRAAWLWFRDHGHPDEAVRHALLAGEPGAAADLVQQVARDMQRAGSLRKLVRLMRLLPAAEIQARPGLQLWTLQLDVYARDFDACAATIARLKSGMPTGDARSRYRLVLLEGAAAVQRDDIQSAINVMPELLVPPANADGWHITPRNGILAWIYLRAGKYEEARRIQEESAQILVDGAPLLGTSGACSAGAASRGSAMRWRATSRRRSESGATCCSKRKSSARRRSTPPVLPPACSAKCITKPTSSGRRESCWRTAWTCSSASPFLNRSCASCSCFRPPTGWPGISSMRSPTSSVSKSMRRATVSIACLSTASRSRFAGICSRGSSIRLTPSSTGSMQWLSAMPRPTRSPRPRSASCPNARVSTGVSQNGRPTTRSNGSLR